MKRKPLQRGLRVFWYLVLVFLYAPLAVVVLFSFNAANTSANFTGFTLDWYARLLNNEQIINGFHNSLMLAVTSSTVGTVIGTVLGYGMYKYRRLKLGWLVWLVYLPIVMPDIVFGISEMTFFVTVNRYLGILEPGLGTMIIAHVTFQVPFVALLVYSRFVGLDATLFEATRDLYATPLQRAWHFILPVIRPAVISGFFLAFTLSIDDFVISFFTAGPESATLPIYIWSAIKKGVTPEINAISTLLIAAVFSAAAISLAIQRARPATR